MALKDFEWFISSDDDIMPTQRIISTTNLCESLRNFYFEQRLERFLRDDFDLLNESFYDNEFSNFSNEQC